jgi:uncharacterized membrane protein YkvI
MHTQDTVENKGGGGPSRAAITLRIAGALCAFLIGGSIASGQETLQFFVSHGTVGLAAIGVYFALICVVVILICGAGKRETFANPYDVYSYYCGKTLGLIYSWFAVFVYYCIFVAMLSGAGATASQLFGIPTHVGTIVMAALALTTTLLGSDRLIRLLGFIGPVNAILLISLGAFAVASLIRDPDLLASAGRAAQAAELRSVSSGWLRSGVLYMLFIMMIVVTFLINCIAGAPDARVAKRAGMLGFTVYALVLVMLTLAEFANFAIIQGKQIPTIVIAHRLAPALGIVFSLLILLAMYATTSSMLLMSVRKFANDRTKKFTLIAIIFAAVGTILGGSISFDILVNKLFLVTSYAGIPLLALILKKELTRPRRGQ